jgi:hypothetical protein
VNLQPSNEWARFFLGVKIWRKDLGKFIRGGVVRGKVSEIAKLRIERKEARRNQRAQDRQRRDEERELRKRTELERDERNRKHKVLEEKWEREKFGIQILEVSIMGKTVRLLGNGFIQVYFLRRSSARYERLKSISAQTDGMSGVITIATDVTTHVLRTGSKSQKDVDNILRLEARGTVLLNQLGMTKVTLNDGGQTQSGGAISSGLADEVQKLADLRKTGLLTEEEFSKAKARLLGN